MATKKGSGTLVEDTVSETSPQILLHPLVLVTLNDHATRSNVRKIGPIIGAVLGAHHGKEITMEFAFECGVDKMMEKNGELTIDGEWFTESLALYGETYPTLSLVGWYSVGILPTAGHARLQMQFRSEFECDNPIFLLYHWDQLDKGAVGGKLPFTLYESFAVQDVGGMELDSVHESHSLRFRPLTYSLETTDDEAIALADIVHGATSAAAVQQEVKPTPKQTDTKGKKKATSSSKDAAVEDSEVTDFLSPEDEDAIAFINSRANAIKMLQSRLAVIIAYLKSQPASYVTDASIAPSSTQSPDYQILRSIAALEAQLHLSSPADVVGMKLELYQSKTDVELVSLLSTLTKTVGDVKTFAKRSAALEPLKRKANIADMLNDPRQIDAANDEVMLS